MSYVQIVHDILDRRYSFNWQSYRYIDTWFLVEISSMPFWSEQSWSRGVAGQWHVAVGCCLEWAYSVEEEGPRQSQRKLFIVEQKIRPRGWTDRWSFEWHGQRPGARQRWKSQSKIFEENSDGWVTLQRQNTNCHWFSSEFKCSTLMAKTFTLGTYF